MRGVYDEIRTGRPWSVDDKQTVAVTINRAPQTKSSDGSTQWSTGTLATEAGISNTTVPLWLQTFTVQPGSRSMATLRHPEGYKLSPDRSVVKKVGDERASGSV